MARNEIASKLVASYIFEPDVATMNVGLLKTSRSDDDHDIKEYRMLEDNPYIGKDCFEVFMDLKQHYNSILMRNNQGSNQSDDHQSRYRA